MPGADPTPASPPRDAETLSAWLTHLEAAAPDDRRQRLSRLHQDPGTRPYVELLETMLTDIPSAVEVVDRWTEAGRPEEEARQLLARLVEQGALDGWTDWGDVADRSEVQLRLQILAESGSVNDGFARFLTFFFRASDPELYRWAAIALGRHLYELPEAEAYVDEWARPRNLDLHEPARLDGTRSPRRLAFLQAGAASRAAHAPAYELGDPQATIDALVDRADPDVDPVDLSAALRIADLLLERAAIDPESARGLLERTPGSAGDAIDRNLLDAWAQLYARVGPPQADDVLQRVARGALDELGLAETVGRTTAALEGLDILIRAVTRLEPDRARDRIATLLDAAPSVEARWIQARVRTWVARRQRGDPSAWLPDGDRAAPTDEAIPGPIQLVLDHRWPAAGGARLHEPRTEASLALLDDLLDLFESERRWHAASLGTRAVTLFTVLDLIRHGGLPGVRLSALLDEHGVVEGGPEPVGGNRAQRRSALARVLACLVDWEEASGDPLLDARTIHQIDDGLLMLGFVPTHRAPSWLSGLADAIEHRFRWHLRRDEAFRPVAFLARFTVREPHPRLFDALADTSRDRSYTVPGRSEDFPLSSVAEDLATQARADRQGAPLGEILAAWDPGPLASWDPTARDISRLRKALADLGSGEDGPGIGARTLSEIVGRTDPTGKARGPTLLGLLAKLHTPGRAMPRTGDPPWTSDTLETILKRTSDEAAEAAAMAEEIEAETDVHEMRALLERLRGTAIRLVGDLEDGLPLAETRLLVDRARAIDGSLNAWIGALGAVEDAQTQPSAGDTENLETVVDTVTDRWSGPARRGVLIRIWRGLAHPDRDDEVEPEPHETWPRREDLVRWGCTTPTRERWTRAEQSAWDEEVARSYEALLQELMAANREDRVLELLQAPDFERARSAAIVQDTIQAARDWCRDRYRLGGSLAARRTLARHRGEQPPGLVGEAGAFMAHFSPVWSALLVGAIFLLDFGDAWVELAQAGDVRGIALTCLIGVVGAYLYVVRDLRSKVAPRPGESTGRLQVRLLGRSAAFTGVCIAVAATITSFLWWLLSNTQAVVRGPWALANVAVWTGFALFVGIVFGLVIQKGL